MNKDYKVAISMMSGTSVDGIDAILVKIYPDLKTEVLVGHFMTYDRVIREKLLKACNNQASTSDVCVLNFLVAKQFSKCALELMIKAQVSKDRIDFISTHGQTVYHIPEEVQLGQVSSKSTLQIGDISVVAHNTGIVTVGDFRPKDIAAGGFGAPLVPFADEIIFRKETPRIIQNIGGIGNMTVLSEKCETFGFDTGVGNMLIDYCTNKFFNKPFDESGDLAFQGKVYENWLNDLLSDPYYKIEPPKTTGREYFNEAYIEKALQNAPNEPKDIIATLTKLTARSIFNAYIDFVKPKTEIKEIVVGGGGAYNKCLLKFLIEDFKDIQVKTHEEFNINDKHKEAIAFALLGYYTFLHQANNVPSVTGANQKVVMGKIAY